MTWDVTREAHGVGLGRVGTDWCSLWSTEREYWSKPGVVCRYMVFLRRVLRAS